MSKTTALLLFGLVAAIAALAPVHNLDAPNAIPNKYLVVLAENSTEAIRDFHTARLSAQLLARSQGEKVLSSFKIGTLIGYAVYYSKDMLEQERDNPLVRYIENDQVVTINDDEPEEDTTTTQSPAVWGLDRIDQAALPLNNRFTYWTSAGAGVYAYIIDTGIYEIHEDFQGRAVWGYNSISGEGFTDGNGHGTHVASTTGGVTYGVAKKSTLIAVKALSAGGSGSWEGVIACIQYVANDHTKRSTNSKRAKSVANMSLGGGVSSTVDNAVIEAIKAGVNFAIASGNNNADACNYSPARVATSLSTVASNINDAKASFSNYGSCTKIIAPGQDITAAWIGGKTATNKISGTSMAAPHVCGAVAVYLGHLTDDSAPTPASVLSAITTAATSGKITGITTATPNKLLFVASA